MHIKISEIIERLKKKYPHTKTALVFRNPLEILVATILSAQCTDKQVNKVTPAIFEKYKTAKDYANADMKVFDQEIKSTGFYRNKAKHIINTCKIVSHKFNNKVPNSMSELLSLPGVARKTANIVLGNAYNIVEGIAVDTHVKRLSKRIGLSKNTDPKKIEQDLMKLIPKSEWFNITNLLIDHGRNICKAKKPDCSNCFIADICQKEYK